MNLPPGMSARMGINREQLVQNIELSKAKVMMHEALIDTQQKRDLEERKFWYDIWQMLWTASGRQLPPNFVKPPEHPYFSALRAHWKAQEDILQVQLAQLRAELAIYEKMLQDGDSQGQIMVPSGVILKH